MANFRGLSGEGCATASSCGDGDDGGGAGLTLVWWGLMKNESWSGLVWSGLVCCVAHRVRGGGSAAGRGKQGETKMMSWSRSSRRAGCGGRGGERWKRESQRRKA